MSRKVFIADKPTPHELFDAIFPCKPGAKLVIRQSQLEKLVLKAWKGMRRRGPMTRTEKRALARTVVWFHAANALSRLGVDLRTEPILSVTIKDGGTQFWVQIETELGVREYPLTYLFARPQEHVEADAGGGKLRKT